MSLSCCVEGTFISTTPFRGPRKGIPRQLLRIHFALCSRHSHDRLKCPLAHWFIRCYALDERFYDMMNIPWDQTSVWERAKAVKFHGSGGMFFRWVRCHHKFSAKRKAKAEHLHSTVVGDNRAQPHLCPRLSARTLGKLLLGFRRERPSAQFKRV